MRHTLWPWIAAVSAVLAAAPAMARPRYGGVIRVETRATSLEPAANPRLLGTVYERLTRFADTGAVTGELAVSWRSDGEKRRWRFVLRSGVKFHDGMALAAPAVALLSHAR